MSAGEDHRLGVLAFGDSITNGGGELQWGVALQSWAQWVARALGLPLTNYAVDGAYALHVVNRQIPAFERGSAHPEAHYELGCLYIGVNDVRGLDFDLRSFAHDFGTALAFLTERCDRVLAVTIPLRLGVPQAGADVAGADAAIERAASELGALVLDLRHFGARNLVMADRVHPTAFGQIAIAERALTVLEREGLSPRIRPNALIDFETSWWGRLRGDGRYLCRYAKLRAQAALSRAQGAGAD